MLSKAFFLSALVAYASADCYMHMPRGSNNRQKTEDNNPEVENNNRLFDSQNNNDGGYDLASGETNAKYPARYYTGSALTVQWSSQHACGKESWIHCQFVLQYMCDESCTSNDPQACRVRDGASNDRIQYDDGDKDTTNDESDNVNYGLHESWYSYNACHRRERNKGLFIADRVENNNLNGRDARYTRQNNNANRRGLECPEERDYYPYWAPSEWKDLAVLVDDASRCDYYYETTQNTNPRYHCVDPLDNIGTPARPRVQWPITEPMCTSQMDNTDGRQYEWAKVDAHFGDRADLLAQATPPATSAHPNEPFWGAGNRETRRECVEMRAKQAAGEVDMTEAEVEDWCTGILSAPDCVENVWQRDNHLGTVTGGYLANYTWMLPDAPAKACVLRIRYNMSSADYDPWNTFSSKNGDEDISPVTQDPYITWNWNSQPLSLALNTNQYGRTFQDRSHTFAIIPRTEPSCWKDHAQSIPCDTANLGNSKIHNVQVTGKRGVLTQVYPSLTLDFSPQDLHINRGDFVHFQWEGESNGVDNYWGGGQPKRARTNIVQIANRTSNFPLPHAEVDMFPDQQTITAFAMAGQEKNPAACQSLESLLLEHNYQAANENEGDRYEKLQEIREDPQNCMWLNQAPGVFLSTPIQFNSAREFHYMSTRNNFPGRMSQKGSIFVHDE